MNELKTPRESLESLIGESNYTYTLRYCDYNPDFSYSHDYPKVLETDDVNEVIEFIEDNYSDTVSLKSMSKFRYEYISRKLPYLHLIMTPSGRHSYIKEFSTQPL